ncbi:MAG: hypothetical protein AAGK14_12915 [Verrucomicrobiota bacterium]
MCFEIERRKLQKRLDQDPELADTYSWLLSLIDDPEFFRLEEIGPLVGIYTKQYFGGLITHLMEGAGSENSWFFSGLTPPSSAVLFSALSKWLDAQEGGWCFVASHHESSWWEIRMVFKIETAPAQLQKVCNYLLRAVVAEQGGVTCVGLLTCRRDALVLFSDNGSLFKIEYYGSESLLLLLEEGIKTLNS